MKVRALLVGLFTALTALTAPTTAAAQPAVTYPYLAAISQTGRYYCAGALIAPQWVITAKQCGTVSPAALSVRIGSTSPDNGGVVAAVAAIHRHPTAQIALMRLDRQVSNPPLPLGGLLAPPNHRIQALGWSRGAQRALPTVIEPDSRCQIPNSPAEICVRNPGGVNGLGPGDVGGPLLRVTESRTELVGVGLYGVRPQPQPWVYAEVPAYGDWIRSITGIPFD